MYGTSGKPHLKQDYIYIGTNSSIQLRINGNHPCSGYGLIKHLEDNNTTLRNIQTG